MPEIGASLREARMRARIDITEVEQATKIRAKYLRALENEEWNLLPGPTFIKSFLREYADYLGLDSRTLVEEYKLRYERPSEQDLAGIGPSLGAKRRSGPGPGVGRTAPRWAIVGVVLVALVAALYAVGTLVGDDTPSEDTAPETTAQTQTQPAGRRSEARRAATAPTRASVRLVATGTIYVCMVDGAGRVLIPGTQFEAGQRVPLQRARVLRLTLGNNQVRMRANGRPVAVPASADAIAFEVTPRAVRTLSVDSAPTCT